MVSLTIVKVAGLLIELAGGGKRQGERGGEAVSLSHKVTVKGSFQIGRRGEKNVRRPKPTVE